MDLRCSPCSDSHGVAAHMCSQGGKHDASDGHLLYTAKREANEEVGLPHDAAKPVAVLDFTVSKHGILVLPVICVIPPDFKAVPNESEVSAVFSCPLSVFLEDKNHRYNDILYGEHPFRLHFFDVTDPTSGLEFLVWGMTAYVMINVAQAAFGRAPSFEPRCPDGPDRSTVINAKLKALRASAAARASNDTTAPTDDVGSGGGHHPVATTPEDGGTGGATAIAGGAGGGAGAGSGAVNHGGGHAAHERQAASASAHSHVQPAKASL